MNQGPALPTLEADLLLLHAPAFFDFRDRDDVYFPFLGTNGAVAITPLFEYFPVGFKTLQRYLSERAHDVRLLNLGSLLVKLPSLDVDAIFRALDVPLVGIDLHWMVHVQGALAVAERLKAVRPEIRIIFGGISATYYALELIRYPFIDMVMRGYDTHEPLHRLLLEMKGARSFERVPNLLWKANDGRVTDNGFAHKPKKLTTTTDWTSIPPATGGAFSSREFLSFQGTGCTRNCGWCGGSRDAFRLVNGTKKVIVRAEDADVRCEFESMTSVPDVDKYYLYSLGLYNQTNERAKGFLDVVGRTGLKSVMYEQFRLTPDDVLKSMVIANKHTTIMISPESHDRRVSKLAGRGNFTNEELESWIDRALEIGIDRIEVWYFVGMPEQDERSVQGTVEYATRLLEKKGKRVAPMICPMIPFLDPASTFFEKPEAHGYRVFFRTAEEHRRGMERASLINRMNYETKWLSRRQLVEVGFRAVRDLMAAKRDARALPQRWVTEYNRQIDDALTFGAAVYEADSLSDPRDRAAALKVLSPEILRRNRAIFTGGVSSQMFPVSQAIGGRWIDELGWPEPVLEHAARGGPPLKTG
jgi:clorobiocin biosynthesis protein CloN6